MKVQANLAAAALALAMVCGQAAHAGTVLSDNFNGENGGASALNYTGFTNWTSTGSGFVDLVATPDYGITCAGGGGSCVDLAGTPGPGEFMSKQAFSFAKGQLITLSFDISGDQRDSSYTDFYAGLLFPGNATVLKFTEGGAWSSSVFDPGLITSISQDTSVTANAPWATYSFSFIAGSSGEVQPYFGSSIAGNIGPLLDNVNLSISDVPEPGTWAMLILGMAMIGFAARRRSAGMAVAA